MKTSTILLVEHKADDAELAMRAFERTPVSRCDELGANNQPAAPT